MNYKKEECIMRIGKKILTVMLGFALAVLSCACEEKAPQEKASSGPETSGQRLFITGNQTETPTKEMYTVPQSDCSVAVCQLEDVAVVVEGRPVPLEEALHQGKLRPEEIAVYARMDAADGFCRMQAKSQKGLTEFVYAYDQVTVRVVHDIYETPDGKQHLIETVNLWPVGVAASDTVYCDEYGQPLDKEDWGLAFTAEAVSEKGMTLICSQKGGQQAGILRLDGIMIISQQTGDSLDAADLDQQSALREKMREVPLERDSTTTVELDWSAAYGQLSAGTYILRLFVVDEYDPEDLHPLQLKYRDGQTYQLEISVP